MLGDRLDVLFVGGRRGERDDIVRLLEEAGVATHCAENTEVARTTLRETPIDVVLLDLHGHGGGLETLSSLHELVPDLPVVVIGDAGQAEVGVGALHAGAQDYLVRGAIQPQHLMRTLYHSLERHRFQKQVRQLFMANPDGILVIDTEGVILFANPAATRLFGRSSKELLGCHMGVPVVGGARTELGIGIDRFAEMHVSDIIWNGTRAYLAALRDVTVQEKDRSRLALVAKQLELANQRLEEMVTTDPLTGVLNRRGLAQVLSAELKRARRLNSSLVACLIDCDKFKHVNDTLGYAAGDEVLKNLAKAVQHTIRKTDHIGRAGGDEFLALLPDIRIAQGIKVAEKIRLAILAAPMPVVGNVGRVTASIGVAVVSPDICTVEEVLALTESSLKTSKHAGRNRVSARGCVVDETASEEMADLTLIDIVKRGRNRLKTLRQDIVQLSEERVVGYEFLIRGPEGPLELPANLFGAASEQNLLVPVDLECLRAILSASSRMQGGGRYHVNLFPRTIASLSSDELVALLTRFHDPRSYCLEISEQQFVGDLHDLREHREAFREVGVKIALDDVGFGRSSLEALIVLEPDIVKIDHRNVVGVSRDPGRLRSLERLLLVVRSLRAEAIVEGIETRDDLLTLRDLGVQYGQGFLWGRPEPFTTEASIRVVPRRAGGGSEPSLLVPFGARLDP